VFFSESLPPDETRVYASDCVNCGLSVSRVLNMSVDLQVVQCLERLCYMYLVTSSCVIDTEYVSISKNLT
jgi:uncharacterized protein (DUF924 family)